MYVNFIINGFIADNDFELTNLFRIRIAPFHAYNIQIIELTNKLVLDVFVLIGTRDLNIQYSY